MLDSIWGIVTDTRYIWRPDVSFGSQVVDYDIQAVLGEFGGWHPDLILTCDSAFSLTGKMPCIHALYGVDNHVRNYEGRDWTFDRLFLAHHDGYARPVRRGCEQWLPCAYDPIAFTPSPTPIVERPYDVGMIGYPYPYRIEVIKQLRAAGFTVQAGLGALYDEYKTNYHNAKVSLCVSAAEDVAQRVFETAAMGCLILTDRLPDLERLGAIEGHHYLAFDTPEEAVDKTRWALEHPKELKRIASEGQAWAAPHTWDARANTILDWLRSL